MLVEEEGLEVIVSSLDCGSSLVYQLVMVAQVQMAAQSAYLHLLNFDSDRLGFDCDCVVLESHHPDAKVVQEVVVTVEAYTDCHRSCPPERDQELDAGHDVEVSAVKEWYTPKAWAHPGSNKSAVEKIFRIPIQYYAPMSHVPVWSNIKRSESCNATIQILP